MTDSYFSWCYVIVMGVAGNQLFLKTDGNTDQTNVIWNSWEGQGLQSDGQGIISDSMIVAIFALKANLFN